jgi:hypothetical protein
MGLFKKARPNDDTEMAELAADLGLSFAKGMKDSNYKRSTYGLADLPLFSHGNAKNATNIIYGTLEGVRTQILNFRVRAYADDPGREYRTCVLLDLGDVDFPALWVSPAERLPRLSESIAKRPLRILTKEFQTSFRVQAADEELATLILDEQTQAWLQSLPVERLRFELKGDALLAHAPDLPGADEVRPLIDAVQGFRERIPEAAWAQARGL